MKCPRDNETMDEVEVNGVMLDICTKCGGVWMDSGELSNASSNMVTEHELMFRGKSELSCPRCKKTMKLANLHSVIVDDCKCGIFFDKGEAGKVLGDKFNFLLERDKKELHLTRNQIKKLMDAGKLDIENVAIKIVD